MKKSCKSLREYAMEVTNFKNKKRRLWTKEKWKSYQNAKIVIFIKNKLNNFHIAYVT